MTSEITKGKDRLFAETLAKPTDFIFDEKVAQVFPDMIQRSVPGYTAIIHMIGQLAQRYVQKNSNCYDLGCSLGAASLSMRQRIDEPSAKVIGIDNSEDMLKRCRENISRDVSSIPIQLLQQDLSDDELEIKDCSVCVLNFTLQFVDIEKRKKLLSKIFDGMLPGGILILSEKIAFENEESSSLMSDLHHYFKKTNGYSELEISQKRNAIENVLVPETIEQHQTRLKSIGFTKIEQWFQCFNFCSLFAFKN